MDTSYSIFTYNFTNGVGKLNSIKKEVMHIIVVNLLVLLAPLILSALDLNIVLCLVLVFLVIPKVTWNSSKINNNKSTFTLSYTDSYTDEKIGLDKDR